MVPTLESVHGEVALAGTQGVAVLTTVNGGISFDASGAEQVEVKKHRVTATFPGSDQGINLDTVNGAITLE